MYANKVKKTNMFEWAQERTLVITDKALYNIHKKNIKRVIRIDSIDGLTKCTGGKKNDEFTVHVSKEYDYRFTTEQ